MILNCAGHWWWDSGNWVISFCSDRVFDPQSQSQLCIWEYFNLFLKIICFHRLSFVCRKAFGCASPPVAPFLSDSRRTYSALLKTWKSSNPKSGINEVPNPDTPSCSPAKFSLVACIDLNKLCYSFIHSLPKQLFCWLTHLRGTIWKTGNRSADTSLGLQIAR